MSNNFEYRYHFKQPVEEVFNCIKQEQLNFFKQYDKSINTLTKGLKIKREMPTKTSHELVKVKMIVQELIENKEIEVVTRYHQGDIVTTYSLEEHNGETDLVYAEDNHFDNDNQALNFQLVGFFYKWMYKRQMKKRMQYIESKMMGA